MDKVKLEIKAPIKRTIEYSGVVIEIDAFLSMAEVAFLINAYVEKYFSKREDNDTSFGYNYIDAELSLMNFIFQLKTNIDINGLTNDIYAETELWDRITKQIVNYEGFRKMLSEVLAEKKEQRILESSIGTVLSGFIEKLYGLLEKFSEASPEEIEKLQASTVELVERLEKTSVLGKTAVKKPARKKAQQ